MFTLPNFISLIRFPLAFVFLSDNFTYRCIALLLAGLSDVLDGFIARKFNMRSEWGTILDPLMDKFFVIFVLSVLLMEQWMSPWQAATMLSRDIAVLVFGAYLTSTGKLKTYKFRSLWWGKATTFLQLIVIFAVISNFWIPPYVYPSFIVLGICAFVELSLTRQTAPSI